MTTNNAVEKLRVLLPHWVEHNRKHGDEFRAWADELRKSGPADAAALLENAIGKMKEVDALLESALEKLGGAQPGHHHHHHD